MYANIFKLKPGMRLGGGCNRFISLRLVLRLVLGTELGLVNDFYGLGVDYKGLQLDFL